MTPGFLYSGSHLLKGSCQFIRIKFALGLDLLLSLKFPFNFRTQYCFCIANGKMNPGRAVFGSRLNQTNRITRIFGEPIG
jgi:hypothetical protein